MSTDVDFPQLKRSLNLIIFLMLSNLQMLLEIWQKKGASSSILLEYGKVTISWWSHKIKSLHVNDFILSTKTEQI